MELRVYSGARIATLKRELDEGRINLNYYIHCIVHVGTNDIRDFSVDRIIAEFREFIVKFKCLASHVELYISSILPRPVDFEITGSKCSLINKQLASVCSKYKVKFIRSYKRFLSKGRTIRSLFAF